MTWSVFDGGERDWDAALDAVDADNLYQTGAWGRYRRAMGWSALQVMGRTGDGHVAAMAQVLFRRQLGVVVAWIPGGPAGAPAVWAEGLPAFLRRHFGRFLYCRINALTEWPDGEADPLRRAGWRVPGVRLGTGLSLEIDLRPDADRRVAATSGNWRHNLRRSGRHGLTVTEWREPDPAAMAAVYRDMEELKGLGQQHSETGLRAMLAHLGPQLVVFRCSDQAGNLLAFRAAGLAGRRAWDMLAAATRSARKCYASHATLWALAEACRQRGAVAYDLGGVDPVGNKGVFDFKQGTGARRVDYGGEWEWAALPLLGTAVGLAMKRRGAAA